MAKKMENYPVSNPVSARVGEGFVTLRGATGGFTRF